MIGTGTVYVGATHCSLLIPKRGIALAQENSYLRDKIRKSRDPEMERRIQDIGFECDFSNWRDEVSQPWHHPFKLMFGIFMIGLSPYHAIDLVDSKRVNTKLRSLLKEQNDEFINAIRERHPQILEEVQLLPRP